MSNLSENSDKVQDGIANSWVDSAPKALRPYLQLSRFDRPVGAWLLFIPCLIGVFIAGVKFHSTPLDVAHFIAVCALGSWLMRGAGCTWNDIVDRKIDAQVERTKSRPLPSGRVKLWQAGLWMIAQAAVALLALLTLNFPTIITAISSLVIVAFYPFAKRITYWPQVVLGLAFNWGALLAWVELGGRIDFSAILLYLALVFWTLFYDTIYAFQDISDDKHIGVKSSARAVSENPERYLQIFLVFMWVLMILALWVGGISNGLTWLGTVLFLLALELMRREFDPHNREKCLMQFRGNTQIGQGFSLVLALGYALMALGISL